MKVATAPVPLMATPDFQPGVPQPPVVHDHARLGQGEGGEDADGVERDQGAGVATEGDDEDQGAAGQHQDPVAEHQAVAPVGQLTGQEAVAGHQRGQPGEVGVGGVGGQDQDRRGEGLQGEVDEAARRRTPPAPMVDRTVCSSDRVGWRRWARTEMPRKAVPRMTPIQVRVRPALRLSGALKALTPLEMASTPVRATAPDENARRRANRVTPLTSAPLSVKWSSWLLVDRQGREVAGVGPVEAEDDERGQGDDVAVGREGEEAARLLDPAEVARGSG